MSSLYLDRDIFMCPGIDRLLVLRDGRCWLESHTESHRHSVCDTAQNAPGMIGLKADMSLFIIIQPVIMIAPAHMCCVKTGAEPDRLDCGDPEHDPCDPVLYAVKHRISDPGRNSLSCTDDDTAHTVPFFTGPVDSCLHFLLLGLAAYHPGMRCDRNTISDELREERAYQTGNKSFQRTA